MKLAVVGTGMIVDLLGAHLIEWGCDVAAIVGTPNTMDRVNELVDDKRETSPPNIKSLHLRAEYRMLSGARS